MSSDWKRLLVSFFMFIISYRYIFPSFACRITIITLKTLYLSYSKKIQHIIQIYFFSDMDLIFRFSHIIQQKFQNQCTSKSSSFNLKIRKSHWHINILDISHTNKPRVLHCFGEKIAFSCARCCTDMILAIFSQIFLADCFITSFSIFTTKPTAFIAQEFYFCFLL